jgi:hypothetical protein
LCPQNTSYLQALQAHYEAQAKLLLQLREFDKAAEVAAEFPPLFPDAWQPCLVAARLLARCASAAEADSRLEETRRRERARAHADRAVQRLREAVEKGYQDPAALQNDRDLACLRDRPDYQQLVGDLAKSKAEAGRGGGKE